MTLFCPSCVLVQSASPKQHRPNREPDPDHDRCKRSRGSGSRRRQAKRSPALDTYSSRAGRNIRIQVAAMGCSRFTFLPVKGERSILIGQKNFFPSAAAKRSCTHRRCSQPAGCGRLFRSTGSKLALTGGRSWSGAGTISGVDGRSCQMVTLKPKRPTASTRACGNARGSSDIASNFGRCRPAENSGAGNGSARLLSRETVARVTVRSPRDGLVLPSRCAKRQLPLGTLMYASGRSKCCARVACCLSSQVHGTSGVGRGGRAHVILFLALQAPRSLKIIRLSCMVYASEIVKVR